MTRILLIRHGRTAWNKEERFRGIEDLALDDVGRAQAQALARRLVREYPSLAAVYASPLRRAQQTAWPIASTFGLTAQAEPGLMDVNYGAWQGLTPAEVAERYPVLYATWQASPDQVYFPGGDALGQVQSRVRATLDDCVRRHPVGTIAIVSHLAVCRLLLCSVQGLPLSQFASIQQATGCLNILETSSTGYDVVAENDTFHLRGIAD